MSIGTMRSKYDIFVDEKFIPFDIKYKIIVLCVIFILTFIFNYFLFIQPDFDRIGQLEKQVQASSDDLAKARKAARDLPKHQREFDEVQKTFELTSILLPTTQEIPDLLRNISDLGKHSGLDFLSFVPGAEAPKDFYVEIPIDIKMRGPYHNLGLFLDNVSKLERIVTVNNIKTERVDKEGEEMLLTSSCRLLTYRFTNKKIAPQK